jgi:hypothetical protein
MFCEWQHGFQVRHLFYAKGESFQSTVPKQKGVFVVLDFFLTLREYFFIYINLVLCNIYQSKNIRYTCSTPCCHQGTFSYFKGKSLFWSWTTAAYHGEGLQAKGSQRVLRPLADVSYSLCLCLKVTLMMMQKRGLEYKCWGRNIFWEKARGKLAWKAVF